MSLISVKNLNLSYENQTVISDLDFEVNEGDYLCIVGENGSGKSTLIKALLGLKQVKKGSIVYANELKQNQIGYLPQQSAAQKDFPASVYEVVLSGCANKKGFTPFYSREDKKMAQEKMERLAITDLSKKCYRELSGGQQQRVLLARALCATKKLILLDEPVTGLDPIATNEMYHIIDDLNKDDKITVIMVSHDVKSAVERASHILHLSKEHKFFGPTNVYVTSKIGRYFLDKAEGSFEDASDFKDEIDVNSNIEINENQTKLQVKGTALKGRVINRNGQDKAFYDKHFKKKD